jgi:hypothetical protein
MGKGGQGPKKQKYYVGDYFYKKKLLPNKGPLFIKGFTECPPPLLCLCLFEEALTKAKALFLESALLLLATQLRCCSLKGRLLRSFFSYGAPCISPSMAA